MWPATTGWMYGRYHYGILWTIEYVLITSPGVRKSDQFQLYKQYNRVLSWPASIPFPPHHIHK